MFRKTCQFYPYSWILTTEIWFSFRRHNLARKVDVIEVMVELHFAQKVSQCKNLKRNSWRLCVWQLLDCHFTLALLNTWQLGLIKLDNIQEYDILTYFLLLTFVLKWYLLLFPEVPEDVTCRQRILHLRTDLPEHHSVLLSYLMAHFCRVCQQQETIGHFHHIDKLSQVFCHILLRPPWEQIM